MELFVGNLPDGTSATDLDVLFLGFRPLRLRVEPCGYAVATVIPERLALRAKQHLQGHSLRGCTIEVREFLSRDPANERRGHRHRQRSWGGAERRRGERRRPA